jgi:hypothetical protein
VVAGGEEGGRVHTAKRFLLRYLGVTELSPRMSTGRPTLTLREGAMASTT